MLGEKRVDAHPVISFDGLVGLLGDEMDGKKAGLCVPTLPMVV